MGAGILLAAVGDGAVLVSSLATFTALLVGGSLWALLRRRRARLAALVLALTLLGVVGSWLPPAAVDDHSHVEGELTGEARFPVRADPDAPVRVEGGEGRLEREGDRTSVVLSCPARCSFRVGSEPAFGAGGSARIVDEELNVTMEGGPFRARSVESRCLRLPFALRPFQDEPCRACLEADHLTAGGSGALPVRGRATPLC